MTNRQWVDEVLIKEHEASCEQNCTEAEILPQIKQASATINQKINQELEELLESLPKFNDMKVENSEQMKGYRQAMIEVEAIIRSKIKEK